MIDTKEIIEQAEQFYETAKECIGMEYNNGWYVGNKELSTEEVCKYLFPKNMITATVNLSFCCELLLKSMLNNGTTIREHNLKTLYDSLPTNWQIIIMKKLNYDNKRHIFDYSLNQVGNSFEKWRYLYECDPKERNIQFSFLNNFGIALMTVAHAKYFYEKRNFDKISKTDLELIKTVI